MKTRIPLIALFLLVAQASLPVAVHAATIPVTSTADSGAAGTLRAVLASAADGDTIDATGVSGTILLTTGELSVTNSVTILGPGPANLAVDGNAAGRVFHVGARTTVTISSLTITNGHASGDFPAGAGGGIINEFATLTVSNSTVSGNLSDFGGGGIENLGTLTVADSILSGNFNSGGDGGGGGIFNDGEHGDRVTLTAVNSTLSGNFATLGGGIYNDGASSDNAMLSVSNSTLRGNLAGAGGGIDNEGSGGNATLTVINSTLSSNSAGDGGGGIYNDGTSGHATLTVVNSTLSGNSAGTGGGIHNVGTLGNAILTIVNSTLSGNSAASYSGGIFNDVGATLEIANTILKAGASGANITNVSGTVASDGYNLSSDDGSGLLTATGDQINTDPLLGPLQDNGGPTFTHELLAGSPAVDAGDPNFTPPPDFDQRGPGLPRVVNGRIDIGAFEVQTVVVVDSDGDGVPDAIDQCPDTPRGAIVDATGCSIAQLVPCDGPVSGGTWKSHGQYVAATVHVATDFLKAKLITRRQWIQIVTRAAWSKCGWNRHFDYDGDRDWHRDWDSDRDRDWGRGRDWGRN